MRRAFLTPGIICIILVFVVSPPFLFAQSQIPADPNQFLQVVNREGNGKRDGYQVVFFEVPDTMTGTLYFAVDDPGTLGPDRYPDENTASFPDEVTTYTLIGGSGALSDPTSREADYFLTGNDPRTAGTTLDTLTFMDETGWYYFAGVSPSQGEHIGNKYYFKIVAQVSLAGTNPLKNGFKFDVSLSNAVGTPTGSADINAFAYAWTISLDDRNPEENGGALVWSMFPFVPDNASGNLVSHNWDADNSCIHQMYDTAGNLHPTPVSVSGNNGEATTNFALGGADTLGATWELRVTEETDDNPAWVNTTAYWHSNSATGEVYRTYAASYSPPAADHVTLTTADGVALADNTETERVVLQIVDSSGDPVPFSRDIYVTVDGAAVIDADSTGGVNGTQDALISTDSTGLGWLDVRDGTGETVIVTAYWDATGGSSSFGTATSGTATIEFLDFYATISSDSNASFTVGDGDTVLPVITVTAETAKPDSAFGLRVRIPSGLAGEFDTGVSPGLGGAIFGITTGTTYPDAKTLRIGIDGPIANGETLTLTNLEMRNFTAASNGKLELSWDDGSSYTASDDKLYIINPAPVIVARETVDLDANGQIDGILITTGDNLDDDFSAITVAVTGYTVSGYNTGAAAGSAANDDTFLVVLNESGTSDTGATPDVEITANTSLASSLTSTLVPDDGGTPVSSTDSAPPVLVAADSNFPVTGGDLVSGTFGSVTYTLLTLTFSEDVSVNSTPGAMSAADFKVEPDGAVPTGDLDGATATVALGAALTDLVVTLTSDTTGGGWTTAGEIDLDSFTRVIDNAGNNAVENVLTEVPVSGLAPIAISWDGGGGSTDWNTAANWSPDQVPGEGDAVTIPNTAPWPVVPLGGANIYSLQIDTGAELSTGGNDLAVFNSFNIDGILRRRGGDTINQTDTDSGTVVYEVSSGGNIQDYGVTDYFNLTFEDTVTFSTGANLSVVGSLTIGDGANVSTLNAGGTVTADALVLRAGSIFDAGNNDVSMTTSYDNNGGTLRRYPGTNVSRTDTDSGETVYYGASGTVQEYGANDYFDLSIDGATFTFSQADNLSVAGTLTVSNGTLGTDANSLSAAAVTVTDVLNASGQTGTEAFSIVGTTPDLDGIGSLSLGAGAANIDGDVTIDDLTGGSAAINVGGYFVPGAFTANTSTLILDGTETPVDLGSYIFNNLTINKSAEADTVNTLGNLTVTGTLALTRGTWVAGADTHSIAGNWDSSSANFSFTEAGSTILLTGTAPAITTEGTADAFLNLQIAGDAVQSSDLSVGGTLAVDTGGSLDTSSSDLSVTGNTTLSGTAELIGSAGAINLTGNLGGTGVFSGGSGAVSIDGTVSGISSFTESSSTTTLSGTAVTFAATTGFTANGGTLIFDGTTSLTSNGETLGNVQIGTGAAGGSLTALDDLRVGGSFSAGTAATTVLDITNVNFYVAADLTLTNLDTFTVTGSTVYLNGAGDLTSSGHSFNNLSISGPGTVTLQDPLVVLGTLAITGGALDINALGPYQVTVGGNWNNSVGTAAFVERTGTVVLNNTGAIQNAETFYDLQVTAGTRSNGTGFTVSNNLTVSGTGALTLTGGMSVTGLATISAGSVTADTGGTVNIGTLTLSGGDLTVTGPAALNVTTGDFSITDNNSTHSGSGNVTISNGDLSISDGAYSAAGTTGITLGDLLVSGGNSVPTGTINAADASFTGAGTVTADNTLTLSGSLSMSNGTLDGTGLIDIAGNVSLTNALATLSGDARTIQVAGDWDESAAVFVGDAGSGTGVVVLDGTAPGITTTNSFYNLTVNGSATLASAITVVNNLNITGGALDVNALGPYQVTVGGNWNNSVGTAAFVERTGTVVLNNTGAIQNAETFYDLQVTAGTRSNGTGFTVSNNLTVSGTGALTLTGGMSVTGLATISAGSVTADTGGTVNIGTLTLSGGDLTVTGPAALNVTTGDFSITDNNSTHSGSGNVTISNGDLSISDGAYSAAGTTGITLGDLLVSGGNSVPTGTINAADASFTGAGTVTADNTLTLSGSLSMSNGTLDGTGLIDIAGNVSLTNALATLSGDARTIQVAGDWDESAAVFVGDAGSGTGVVVLDGTAPGITTINSFYNLTISGTATLGGGVTVDNDVVIGAAGVLDDSGNYTITVAGDWNNGSGGTFTAGTGTVVLNGTTQQINTGGTNGRFNNLTASAGTTAALITSDLYVDNILTITGGSTFDAAARNFTIVTIDFNADTDEFHLAGTQATQSITNADTADGRTVYTGNNGTVRLTDFYDLAINGTGTFPVDPATININGDLVLQSGTLNGNGNLIRIQGDFNGAAAGTFAHGNGTVRYFGPVNALISGDNTFYNFVADDTLETDLSDGVLGKIIQIASNSTQSIAAGGMFQVRGDNTDPPNGGDPESEIDWSARTYTTSWITLRSTDNTAPPYWTIDMDGTATLDMQYVDIWFSYAIPAINVPADTYVHNCEDWLRFVYISESFTRDTDGNGRIDIIEVVVPVALNDDFTDFQIVVNGYDQSGPVSTGLSSNDRLFWIHLEEKPYLDTGVTPSWYIADPGELRDSNIGIYQVSHEPPKSPTNPEVPWDDADPIVGYTLAVPGRNEVFVHFSEPVYGSGAGDALVPEIDLSGPAGNAVSSISVVSGSGGGQEVLLTMTSAVSASDIADWELLSFANIDDNAPDSPAVSPLWVGQPSGYNGLVDVTNRISDLGLGISSGGLINPVWASDGTSISPERGGLGLIRSFDGSAFLQDDDILLEASIHSDLAPLGSTPEILFDGNVPANYTRDSLWLPESADSNGLVSFPYPDASTRSITGAPHPSGSTNLWQFTFSAGDVDIRTGVKLDFFFKLTGANPLYIARLDRPDASDWYRSVRPWSFRVQDLVKQTAEVSIFNNVINPEQGEKATLHYVMEDSGLVTITVFDLAGDLVNVIERGRKTEGEYSTTWDGRNRSGRVVARGIYFIRVVGPGFDEYRKVMVVK
jgi:fibronectin-binding autotransporter adhesin